MLSPLPAGELSIVVEAPPLAGGESLQPVNMAKVKIKSRKKHAILAGNKLFLRDSQFFLSLHIICFILSCSTVDLTLYGNEAESCNQYNDR